MDWYEIEYLYPHAYGKFVKEMFPNVGILSISLLKNYDIKKLYGFFDKQGIFLILDVDNNKNWTYYLNFNGWILSQATPSKNSREEIENEGFYYCFKLMDENLNKKLNV